MPLCRLENKMSKYRTGDIVSANGLIAVADGKFKEVLPDDWFLGQVFTVTHADEHGDLIHISFGDKDSLWHESRFDLLSTHVPMPVVAETKPRLDMLFQINGLRDIAMVFTLAEEKWPDINGDFSWRTKMKDAKFKMARIGSALRHILAYVGGEKIDPEFGQTHLAHAACNLLMVADIEILETK